MIIHYGWTITAAEGNLGAEAGASVALRGGSCPQPRAPWGCRVDATFSIGFQQRKPQSWRWGWFPKHPPKGSRSRGYLSHHDTSAACPLGPWGPLCPPLLSSIILSVKALWLQCCGHRDLCMELGLCCCVSHDSKHPTHTGVRTGTSVLKYHSLCIKPFSKWPLLLFN